MEATRPAGERVEVIELREDGATNIRLRKDGAISVGIERGDEPRVAIVGCVG